eukprot:s28_g2.t2
MAPRAAESTGLGMLTSKASLRADTLGWVIDELATESHRTLLLDRLESQLKAKPHISRMLFAFNASDDRKVQKAIDQEFADWRKKHLDHSKVRLDGVKMGDIVSLHLRDVHIAATTNAFCAVLGDGRVVTWGDSKYGGDCSSGVKHIAASFAAFAAILSNGSVVAWGNSGFGGNIGPVAHQLGNVERIIASCGAFAAICADGSVVTWGHGSHGGDSRAVQHRLRNVQEIHAAHMSFAAIIDDGSVVTWGNPLHGGDSSAVEHSLRNVHTIQATNGAFAAIRSDGSVVTWGQSKQGGDSRAVQHSLQNVRKIRASPGAFAALLVNGSVVTWGHSDHGGDSSSVKDQLVDVQQLEASFGAFAAVLSDGSVVVASDGAFAAIRRDGSVVTWGNPGQGGDNKAVQEELRNVRHIQASRRAFTAILENGQENAAEALTGVIVYTQTFALHLLEGPSELIFKALGFFHSISTEVRQVESPAPGMTPRPNEKGEPPGLVSVVRVLHFTELHAVRVARTWCSMPHPGRATGGAQQPLEEGSCHEMVFSLYKKMLCLCLKVRKLLDGEQDSDGGSLLKTYKKAADELPSIDEVLASSRRPLSPLFRWCSILSCFGPFRPLCLIDDHGGRKTRDPVGCVTILCILPQTGFISGFFQVQHEFA